MEPDQLDKLIHEPRKPGHGAVAIIAENEKFLVIRRSAKVRAPGMLCFAGGTIEAGETPVQAIVREAARGIGTRCHRQRTRLAKPHRLGNPARVDRG